MDPGPAHFPVNTEATTLSAARTDNLKAQRAVRAAEGTKRDEIPARLLKKGKSDGKARDMGRTEE